jgi:hypothetical protein
MQQQALTARSHQNTQERTVEMSGLQDVTEGTLRSSRLSDLG